MYKSNQKKNNYSIKKILINIIFTQISSESGLKKLNKPGFSGLGSLYNIAIPKLRNGLVKSICFSRA